MPRAFTEVERQRIRHRLLAAGKKAINRSGPRLLSLDEIVREAGISKGSFYSFFPSKEDFILTILEAWEAEHRGELIRRIGEGGGSTRDKLERFFMGAFELLEKEPGLAKMGFSDIERLREGLPPERLAAHQARDEEVLSQTFLEWARAGLVDPEALEALPGLVSALFVLALHKEDFRQGGYAAATRLLSQALAQRLATEPKGAKP